jgi:hypothetical protein
VSHLRSPLRARAAQAGLCVGQPVRADGVSAEGNERKPRRRSRRRRSDAANLEIPGRSRPSSESRPRPSPFHRRDCGSLVDP